MSRLRHLRRLLRVEPIHCRCENGADRAKEHAKLGAKAADHGDPFQSPFTHARGCVHSDLRLTSQPLVARPHPVQNATARFLATVVATATGHAPTAQRHSNKRKRRT